MKNCPVCNELLGDQVEQCFRCKYVFSKSFYCSKCNKPLQDEKSSCECGGWAVSPITHDNNTYQGMSKSRQELKTAAKARLRVILWLSILVCLLISPFQHIRYTLTRPTPEGSVFTSVDEDGNPVNLYYIDKTRSYETTDDNYYAQAGIRATIGWYNVTLLQRPVLIQLQSILLLISLLSILVRIFLLNPYEVGIVRFFMRDIYGNTGLSNVLYSFNTIHYFSILKTMFLRELKIFLWSLLLIIPGIIKGYEYYFVPYILSENPDISSDTAFRFSREMTEGYKWELFIFDLSFFFWDLLSIITLGVANVLWVIPYKQATKAQLYNEYREYYLHTGRADSHQMPGFQI